MKVDKQKLAKHHFWILLGVFAVLAVVLLIVVPIGVGGQIEEKEKKYGEMSKKLDDAKNVKSAHYIAVLDDQKGKLGVQRERIHVDMFRRQRDLLAFPGDLNEKYKNKDFGSVVDLNDKIAFRSEEVYMAQYQEMAGLIKPTEFVPNWQSVLMPIEWDQSVAPSDEEVWLSLEDLCVRREILKVLHDANEELARFQPMEGEVAQSKLPMKRKFKSRLWELDLILDRNKNREYVFSGNLKNISGRRLQIREIKFNVWTQPDLSSTERSRPVMFTVFHEALGAEEVLKL